LALEGIEAAVNVIVGYGGGKKLLFCACDLRKEILAGKILGEARKLKRSIRVIRIIRKREVSSFCASRV